MNQLRTESNKTTYYRNKNSCELGKKNRGVVAASLSSFGTCGYSTLPKRAKGLVLFIAIPFHNTRFSSNIDISSVLESFKTSCVHVFTNEISPKNLQGGVGLEPIEMPAK
jgi:hypothetical protein